MALIFWVPKALGSESEQGAVLTRQAAQYRAETAKTIIELQQFRQTESIAAEESGAQRGIATLINLNPRINTWFLLILDWGSEGRRSTYHLENPKAHEQELHLSGADPHGIQISSGGRTSGCGLWFGAADALAAAQRSALPYAPLCGGALYLRNRVGGHYRMLERVTAFCAIMSGAARRSLDRAQRVLHRSIP